MAPSPVRLTMRPLHGDYGINQIAAESSKPRQTLQKFSSVHAQVHNHFNEERHLVTRQVYRHRRSSALAAQRALGA